MSYESMQFLSDNEFDMPNLIDNEPDKDKTNEKMETENIINSNSTGTYNQISIKQCTTPNPQTLYPHNTFDTRMQVPQISNSPPLFQQKQQINMNKFIQSKEDDKLHQCQFHQMNFQQKSKKPVLTGYSIANDPNFFSQEEQKMNQQKEYEYEKKLKRNMSPQTRQLSYNLPRKEFQQFILDKNQADISLEEVSYLDRQDLMRISDSRYGKIREQQFFQEQAPTISHVVFERFRLKYGQDFSFNRQNQERIYELNKEYQKEVEEVDYLLKYGKNIKGNEKKPNHWKIENTTPIFKTKPTQSEIMSFEMLKIEDKSKPSLENDTIMSNELSENVLPPTEQHLEQIQIVPAEINENPIIDEETLKSNFDIFIQNSISNWDLKSVSEKTKTEYQRKLGRYEMMMKGLNIEHPYPINTLYVRVFFEMFIEEFSTKNKRLPSYSYVTGYFKSISYWSRLHQVPDPIKDKELTEFFRGIHRNLQKDTLPNRKIGFLKEDMIQLQSLFTQNKKDIRDWALCVITFFCCNRISETLNLRLRDLEFNQSKNLIRIIIHTSKSLQNGGEYSKCFCNIFPEIPAVEAVIKHLEINCSKLKNNQLIFNIGIKTFTDRLKTKLSESNLEAKKYSTHSFRRGMCQEMLRAGVPENIIKYFGNWRCNQSFHYENMNPEGNMELVKSTFSQTKSTQ